MLRIFFPLIAKFVLDIAVDLRKSLRDFFSLVRLSLIFRNDFSSGAAFRGEDYENMEV